MAAMITSDVNNILAHAVRGCGMKAVQEPLKVHVVEVAVDRHPVTVAVRGLNDDERSKIGWERATVQVMLRLDLQSCERLGLEKGQELDRWLMRQEPALGALVRPFEAYAEPFPGHRLAIQQHAPEDAWVSHMVTVKDRFRDSRWLVVKEA